MAQAHIKKTKSIINDSKNLTDLAQRCSLLEKLTNAIIQAAPQLQAANIRVSSINNGILTITVHEVAFASKLRFFQEQIINIARSYPDSPEITKLSWKINPKQAQKTARKVQRNMTKTTASLLQEAALGIKDSDLKASLERLAQQSRES